MSESIGKTLKITANHCIFKHFRISFAEPPPENVGEEIKKEACVVGLRGTCEKKLPITIKKCVGYNVYFLTPPTNCYKAYCFRKLK